MKQEEKSEISKSKPLYANRVSEDIEKAVIEIAIEFPAYGQERAANEERNSHLCKWNKISVAKKQS